MQSQLYKRACDIIVGEQDEAKIVKKDEEEKAFHIHFVQCEKIKSK